MKIPQRILNVVGAASRDKKDPREVLKSLHLQARETRSGRVLVAEATDGRTLVRACVEEGLEGLGDVDVIVPAETVGSALSMDCSIEGVGASLDMSCRGREKVGENIVDMVTFESEKTSASLTAPTRSQMKYPDCDALMNGEERPGEIRIGLSVGTVRKLFGVLNSLGVRAATLRLVARKPNAPIYVQGEGPEDGVTVMGLLMPLKVSDLPDERGKDARFMFSRVSRYQDEEGLPIGDGGGQMDLGDEAAKETDFKADGVDGVDGVDDGGKDPVAELLGEVCPGAVTFFCDTEEQDVDEYLGELAVQSNDPKAVTLVVLMEGVFQLVKYCKVTEVERPFCAAVVDGMLACCAGITTGKACERHLMEVTRKFGDPKELPRTVLKAVLPGVLDLLDGHIEPGAASEDELVTASAVWAYWDGNICVVTRGNEIQMELARRREEQRKAQAEGEANGKKKGRGKKSVQNPGDKNQVTTIAPAELEEVTERKGLEVAMEQGRQAFKDGKPRSSNPWEKDSHAAMWNMGWREELVRVVNAKTVSRRDWTSAASRELLQEARAMGAEAAQKDTDPGRTTVMKYTENPFTEGHALQQWNEGYEGMVLEYERMMDANKAQTDEPKEIKEDENDVQSQ